MRRSWRTLATVILTASLSLTTPISTANAEEPVKPVPTDEAGPVAPMGPACRIGLCSQIKNTSHTWIYLVRNWCESSDILYRSEPPCGWGNPYRYLYPGEITPQFEDWDAFRVDAGWKYTYTVYFRFCICWSTRSVDQRGSSTPAWVHVHDNEVAVVERQER